MFNPKKQPQVNDKTYPSTNIIGKGTTIRGDIEAEGSFRIEGRLIGNIKTQSKVVLASGAYLKGNISAKNVEIAGNMEGKIDAPEKLVLRSEARVKGTLQVRQLVVEVGAVFNGQCLMQAEAEGAVDAGKFNSSTTERSHAPNTPNRSQTTIPT